MYCPNHFRQPDTAAIHELIRACPLATLITVTADGLNADHIPLMLESPANGTAVLRGHVARANPMWKKLNSDFEALAVFHGPEAYISPNWYPTKQEHGKAVPTWNYVTAHVRGPLQLFESPEWLREQVSALTLKQESPFADPWAVTDAPTEYIDQMLRAIVGIELTIRSIEGKWKTSQNQPETNQRGAVQGLRDLGTADAAAMAALIERP